MKQFIVMSAMIMLGIFIYNLIAGDNDGSLLSSLGKYWNAEISSNAGTH